MPRSHLSWTTAVMLTFGAVACEPPEDPGAFQPPEAVQPEIDDQEPGDFDPACPVDVFLDLSAVEGPGDDYPQPTLEARCEGGELVVETNALPHYAFQQITPNPLQAQDVVYRIPLEPTRSAQKTDIPLLGAVAFAINGAPIYGPNEGAFPDPYGDPIYNDILDWCLGHTAQRGDYHYHALLTDCFFPGLAAEAPDPVIGFALDGFPIYGPRGCADAECSHIVTYESSWVQVGDPTTHAWDNHQCDDETCDEGAGTKLDRCNGHVGPDGDYHYHATAGFPYVLGCYHGEADVEDIGGQGGERPPRP